MICTSHLNPMEDIVIFLFASSSHLILTTDLPTLAKEIVDRNIALQQNDNLLILIPLNLKGFAVGNPYTTVYTGLYAMIETGWGHQLIAQPTYQKFLEHSCLKMDTLDYPVTSNDYLPHTDLLF